MTKRRLALAGAALIGLAAVAGIAWSVLGGGRIPLTQARLQERINRQLPREVKGVTVERASVVVADGRIALTVDVRASALRQAISATCLARGTPTYDAERGE